MLVNQLMHFLDTGFIGPLRRLDFEINWCKQRLPSRLKHLKPDEISDVLAFYDALDDVRLMIPRLHEYKERDEAFIEVLRSAEFQNKLNRLAELRDRAENNILEETDEDEGMGT